MSLQACLSRRLHHYELLIRNVNVMAGRSFSNTTVLYIIIETLHRAGFPENMIISGYMLGVFTWAGSFLSLYLLRGLPWGHPAGEYCPVYEHGERRKHQFNSIIIIIINKISLIWTHICAGWNPNPDVSELTVQVCTETLGTPDGLVEAEQHTGCFKNTHTLIFRLRCSLLSDNFICMMDLCYSRFKRETYLFNRRSYHRGGKRVTSRPNKER